MDPGISDSIVGRAKAGSRSAFAEIVREHKNMVYSVAYHFTRNVAVAEELAQDVFLDLYRNLKRIESASHLAAWLRRTVTHRCIDRSRRSAVRSEVPLVAVCEPTSDDDPAGEVLTQRVRREVASLPEWQRAIVVLRYQEDLELSEIADTLELPLNTVKSRLHRAVQTLRESLNAKQRVKVL